MCVQRDGCAVVACVEGMIIALFDAWVEEIGDSRIDHGLDAVCVAEEAAAPNEYECVPGGVLDVFATAAAVSAADVGDHHPVAV